VSPRTKRTKPWTPEEIRALGARMDGVTACEVVYDVGRMKAYELMAKGAVDFPLIRRGRGYVVPTSAVVTLLRLDEQAGAA
jgi:hypothetical protein